MTFEKKELLMNHFYITSLEALPLDASRYEGTAEFLAVEVNLTAETGILHVINLVIPADDRAIITEFIHKDAMFHIGYEVAISEFVELNGEYCHLLTTAPMTIDYLSDNGEA